jgi:hypothetical protein
LDFEIEHVFNNIPEGKKLLIKNYQKIENYQELDIKEDYDRKKLIKNII